MSEVGSGMDKPPFAALVSGTTALLRANAPIAVTATLLLAGAATAFDIAGEAAARFSTLPLGIAGLVAQSVTTREALTRAGRGVAAPGLRIGSLFLLSLETNLAIIVGLVLLLIPGLYLGARWFVAVPVMYDREETANDAMRASWAITPALAWPLVGLTLLVYVPPFLVGGAVFGLEAALPALIENLAANLLIYGALVIGWHAAVAVYTALDPRDGRELAEIFR